MLLAGDVSFHRGDCFIRDQPKLPHSLFKLMRTKFLVFFIFVFLYCISYHFRFLGQPMMIIQYCGNSTLVAAVVVVVVVVVEEEVVEVVLSKCAR